MPPRTSRSPVGAAVPALRSQRRRLYALTDQGAARPIDVADFQLGGRDRGWNAHARDFITANRLQLDALMIEAILVADRDAIELRLRPGGTVGAVPIRAPHTRRISGGVVVSPRFGWDGVGPMLERIGWSAQPRVLDMPLVPGSAREVPPWVLAGPLITRLGALLTELRRGFRLQETVTHSPRGQILWPRYATDQIPRAAFHRLPCRFPDLGPDAQLRGYVRWGIETVQRSLAPYAAADLTARRLLDQSRELLTALMDTPAQPPDRRLLDLLLRGTGLPSAILSRGIEALGWIVDERGLAGRSEADGLAWALPMHELFERWVEHLVRGWARGFGGQVRTARAGDTVAPIRWSRGGHGSLTSLVPDVTVHHADRVFVFDAKYKGHFQDLDETRWFALAEELRREHRQDVHQVLAYAALFDAARVTAVLAYPMHPGTWQRLSASGRALVTAEISTSGRQLRLALCGVPMRIPTLDTIAAIQRDWDALTLG